MEEQNLKPCPFCGGHAVIADYIDEHDDYWLYIYCEGCGFESTYFVDNGYDMNMADLWNMRVNENAATNTNDR